MGGGERVRRIELAIAYRVLLGNLLVHGVSVAAGVVAGLTIQKLPDGTSPVGPMLTLFGVSVPFFAASLTVSRLRVRSLFQPASGWIAEDRTASVGETLALVRQPWKQTQTAFIGWLCSAPLVALFVSQYVHVALALASATLVASAGMVAMMLSRQSVEEYLRPLLAEALDGATLSAEQEPSVLPRLLSSWIFGSGAYLVGVVVTLLAAKAADLDMTYTAATIAFIGLLVGGGTTMRSAANVGDRVARLREAQRHVEAGDLETRVDVDDPGELGRLQAGFNRMVEGLAQRRVVEDLFGRHVGVDVARRAVSDGAGLRGEERTVSVLFVDIVASTALTQRLEPARVIELLNLFFTEVIDCAARHGGWVNKFEGDGALCIFGAPEELADHAAAALKTAADLRARLDALTAAEPSLQAAIGVSTGTAVAGNVGNETRYEYTVIGDAVNEAARLSEAAKAKPGLLLASARTVTDAGAEGECWIAERRVRLRGREQPTGVYSFATRRD